MTQPNPTPTPAQRVAAYRAHTMGSESLRAHWIGTIVYTDGIHLLAEACGAYWLLDVVASAQPEILRHGDFLASFQVWRLRHADEVWTVDAWSDTPEDEDSTLLFSQTLRYSDFPAELLPLHFWVKNGTALFPEEY